MDQRDKPRYHALLVEDDPTSRSFLCQALESLGWSTVTCSNCEQARQKLSAAPFSLLVIDRNLPDGDGYALLGSLQARFDDLPKAPVALASSAEWTKTEVAAARAAGYADVLSKPCTVGQLASVIGGLLPETLALLDQASAVTVAGSSSNVAALRRLLQRELEQLATEIPEQEPLRTEFSDKLHRLVASAGFCGTPALGAAAAHLRRCLIENEDHAEALGRFQQVLASTRTSLEQTTARP